MTSSIREKARDQASDSSQPGRFTGSVMIVLPWSPWLPGGVSVVVRNIAKHICREHLKSTIVISEWNASKQKANPDETMDFRFSLLPGSGLPGLFKALLMAPLRLARTFLLLRENRVLAINFHYPSLDALGVALLKRLGLFNGRLILSFHGTDVRPQTHRLGRILWHWVLNHADSMSTCSQALAQQAALTFHIPKNRITAIYNGVDTDLFSPIAPKNGSPSYGLPPAYLVSVGSYIPRKGHRILLEAFIEVASEFPELGLVIIGMDGEEREYLIKMATDAGVLSRFFCLVGLMPNEVASVVANAEACVQPSLAEPFGLAVIEAGACGVPVAVSGVGGHLEIVKNDETGLVFLPDNVCECAIALRKLLNNPAKANWMADNFRAEILERFSWQRCANEYAQLILGKDTCQAENSSNTRPPSNSEAA